MTFTFLPKPRPRRRLSPDAVSVLEGPLAQSVWKLAWPVVITNILFSATGLINVKFVGGLGKDALAVVGRSEQILFLFMAMVNSVSVGTSALVARSIGESNRKDAEAASRQSLNMTVLGALVAACVLWFLGHPILLLMNARGADLALSTQYLKIIALVQVQAYLVIVISAIYRGLGDTRTPMYLMIVLNILQVLGDYTMIFGYGFIPRLGVLGAAYSWLFSRTVGAVLCLYFLWRSPLPGAMRGDWRPHWDWFRRIWAIGIPSAIQQFVRVTGSMVFFGFLGALPNGTASVAALTLGLRIESIAFMPGFAYSMAAITMVGQNLGAQQPNRAEKAGWMCAWQAMGMMALAGAAFILLPRYIIHFFTTDPEVVPLGVGYLIANGFAQPLLSLGIALSGALQGAGETRLPAWMTFFTMWFIRVPLTWIFALGLGWGTMAAWGVMAVTNISYGILITIFFKRGQWKDKEI
jgi:putative MATE family efflux protein